jgi:hypothetical protein
MRIKKGLKLSDKLIFGKYIGNNINSIIQKDVQYIHWALTEKIFKLRFWANIFYKIEYRKWERKTRDLRKLVYIARNSDIGQELQAQAFHEDCGDR